MENLKLSDGHSLGIENGGKRVRLIVYNGGVENVCRKESLKKLEDFAQSGDNHLFKGRLQLFKDEVGINVDVKGKIVGRIPTADFINYLNKAKN